jgi:putative transposase
LEAYEKHPNRFKGKIPKPHALPEAAWINKPKTEELESNLLNSVSHFHVVNK